MMFGKLGKAIAGCILGAIVGQLMTKYGGSIGISGVYSGVSVSDVASIGLLGVMAYLTRNKETIGTVMSVATAFQIAALVIKFLVANSGGML